MDDLNFEAEPFGAASKGTCGCANCRGEQESQWDELESDESSEWEGDGWDELEWDVAPVVADKRPRAASCKTEMPAEVLGCRQQAAEKAVLCDPASGLVCPAIPELWKSKSVGGVPFWYGEKTERVAGTRQFRLKGVEQRERSVEMTPKAWTSLLTWVTLMSTFGMPISAIVTAGARYCRCIKTPAGKCRQSTPAGCTGRTLSNHSYGDAIDITGVVWKDPKVVGSSLPATIMHSWGDNGDQGRLLLRMNGALRLAFNTVIDYSDPGHRDHFHVDTNRGQPRGVFGMKGTQNFIVASLQRLGYLDKVLPVTWARAQQGLAAFAQRAQMQAPSSPKDPNAWRPIVNRLYACVALGNPANCRKQP